GSRSIHDRCTAKKTSRTRRRSVSLDHLPSSWPSASSRAATSSPRRSFASPPSRRPSRPISDPRLRAGGRLGRAGAAVRLVDPRPFVLVDDLGLEVVVGLLALL